MICDRLIAWTYLSMIFIFAATTSQRYKKKRERKKRRKAAKANEKSNAPQPSSTAAAYKEDVAVEWVYQCCRFPFFTLPVFHFLYIEQVNFLFSYFNEIFYKTIQHCTMYFIMPVLEESRSVIQPVWTGSWILQTGWVKYLA